MLDAAIERGDVGPESIVVEPTSGNRGTSGTNVAAALRLARKLGRGKTVVTILPDTGERYFSTPLFEGE